MSDDLLFKEKYKRLPDGSVSFTITVMGKISGNLEQLEGKLTELFHMGSKSVNLLLYEAEWKSVEEDIDEIADKLRNRGYLVELSKEIFGRKVENGRLYLGDHLLRDEDLRVLCAEGEKLEYVSYIDLALNQITDKGLEYLKGLTKLSVLKLGTTFITDSGLEHLKALTNLCSLCLTNCPQIRDAGLKHLKELTQLTTIGLAATDVGDAGLEHLKELTQLTTIDLTLTKVTQAGLGDLRKALPKCKIRKGVPRPYRSKLK